jgi:ubiquinone/menaquinone biosynthesis C-methylase UbiE
MRLLAWARTFIGPFDEVIAYAPKAGKFIEIGCGTGIMANCLSLDSPTRSVIGYDINPKVITAAQQTINNRTNIGFCLGDARIVVGKESADVVVAVDLFHHLPAEAQRPVIIDVWRLLKPGGLFLFKDVDSRPRWKYYANWWHDALMARGNPHIHVRGHEEYRQLLESAGFTVEVVLLPKAYVANVLYVCRRVT